MTQTSDTSERGLEDLIISALTGLSLADVRAAAAPHIPGTVRESATALYARNTGEGYVLGNAANFNRDYALDVALLLDFIRETQPEAFDKLGLGQDGPGRNKFLGRVQGEISKRGVVDVLRKGVQHQAVSLQLFFGTPTPGNMLAETRFRQNIFSITRQVRYSKDETQLALDLVMFINGIPVITFELKNSLTKQTVNDAVQQYMNDREPRELLFQFGRCAVHFAVDDAEVRMCTHLRGKQSWFLPFNKGWNDGAGNPPNPDGLKTDYLWKQILTRTSLTDILENYAQIVEKKDDEGNKRKEQIFPRYHQLDVVRKLLADARANGAGQRYLIQHSAGSGKSNSIAWLAHQLVGLVRQGAEVYSSIIVITDRRNLDKQINQTIKGMMQVASVLGHADDAAQLRKFLRDGKKIIVTTVQKFPFILDELGSEHRGRPFALLIDEAHSSQGGRTAAKMNVALSSYDSADSDEDTTEDRINRAMGQRKMLTNASYFAFTATPKAKTLEIFGVPFVEGDGALSATKHRPFHSYTMKQAIQERFIMDVLANYTPVASFYRLMKTIADDPKYDTQKAQRKLRHYVETHNTAVRAKAEIMVDHFHEHVAAPRKLGGNARAMVVTSSIAQAIQYYQAFTAYLRERQSPYSAIVAFSGEHELGGAKVSEATLNDFPSSQIEDKFKQEPYRFLIVADKFQTGYDEPLLHSMYVDKPLAGIKAVQTLSRLNRAHPKKTDTFVLDFVNDTETIRKAFEDYYRTTILSDETDPNKLHDLKADLDGAQVYAPEQVAQFVERYLSGASREQLDPLLDACVAVYLSDLDEDGQVAFKGKAKAFVRMYNFLAAILPYTNAEWEKLSVFLNFLIPKLPAPVEEDLSRGILEAIDMESYRAEVQTTLRLVLADQDAEIDPVPASEGGYMPEPEMDVLSNIVKEFNALFGKGFQDPERMTQILTEEIPTKVKSDPTYQNAVANSDKQNARIEHDRILGQIMLGLLHDHTELFKQYNDNDNFQRWVQQTVFELTYAPQQFKEATLRFPVVQAGQFVQKQFGSEAKWARINRAIWDFFETRQGERLGLGDLQRIAREQNLSVEDMLSVISLLTGPRQDFLRRLYYQLSLSGQIEEVPSDEVNRQMHRWVGEKTLSESEWQNWASHIFVGWEPTSKDVGKVSKLPSSQSSSNEVNNATGQ
jgi:type I restriction enzyme R subunit